MFLASCSLAREHNFYGFKENGQREEEEEKGSEEKDTIREKRKNMETEGKRQRIQPEIFLK